MNRKRRLEVHLRTNEEPYRTRHHPGAITAQAVGATEHAPEGCSPRRSWSPSPNSPILRAHRPAVDIAVGIGEVTGKLTELAGPSSPRGGGRGVRVLS